MLTSRMAQEIATKLTEAVGHNVLLTDAEAVIIGSGDERRVGNFHEPSLSVIQNKIAHPPAETAARRATKRIGGVEPGVTLAIRVEGEILGTVAITGDPSEVDKLGIVVKIQTESMLREASLLKSLFRRERAYQDLLQDIITYEPSITDPASLLTRAEQAGVDLTLPRLAVVIGVKENREQSQESSRSFDTISLLGTIRDTFSGSGSLVTNLGSDKFVVFPGISEKTHSLSSSAQREFQDLLQKLRSERTILAAAGVGRRADDVLSLKWSYYDACNALDLGMKLRDGKWEFHIEEFRFEQLLLSANVANQERFLSVTLGNSGSRDDWHELRHSFTVWCECGYNTAQAARELHVHRNTLVYRLKKIKTITGYDTFAPHQAFTLYAACLLERLRAKESIAVAGL